MKYRIIFPVLLILCVISISGLSTAQTQGKTVYYFYAENCSACKQAEDHFRKPDGIKDGASWRHGLYTFVPYRIVDERNRINNNNMKVLTDMLDSLERRLGKSDFVYFRREVYEYYKNRGIPHYRKEDRYSRRDDPFPTPVFIIGDRVVLGFNLPLIQQSMNAMN